MLITDDFVFLNFPKTGTTFTRKVIKKIYGDACQELLLPNAFNARAKHLITQHGTYAQIPKEHRAKPIYSIARNPFDRYVSLYYFKWYSHSPPANKWRLKLTYKNFPDIDFESFLDMSEKFSKKNILKTHGVSEETIAGYDSVHFLAFHASDPRDALNSLATGRSNPFDELPEINFLHQETLREDLVDMLSKITGDHSHIENIIRSETDMNASEDRKGRSWKDVWTEELLSRYKFKDSLLLSYLKKY